MQVKCRTSSLRIKVLKSNRNRNMANFNVRLVLDKINEYLTDNPPNQQEKIAICRILTNKCDFARRCFMDLDASVYPVSFWNEEEGTIISSSSSDSLASVGPTMNEAESTSDYPVASNASVHNENMLPSDSTNCEQFIKHVILTMDIITDERNIIDGINNTFYEFWPKFKYEVINDVCLVARIPCATIDQWINQAPPPQ